MSDYKQVLDRIWYAEDVFSKRFSQCGGRQDQYDSRVCTGEAHDRAAGKAVSGAVAKAAQNTSIGIPAVTCFTSDSGIQERIDGFLGCITENPAPGAAGNKGFTAANQDCKVVTVVWPLNGVGVFSACTARDEMAPSNPHRFSCLAIPHVSVCQVDILFKGLKECIFRNLSNLGGAGDGTLAANASGHGVSVELDSTFSPTLQVEYLRLASWYPQPERVNLPTFP